MKKWIGRHKILAPSLLVAGMAAAAGATLLASDHQQTVFTETRPHYDITDVHAFPAATAGRIVLAVTTSSPLLPQQLQYHGFGDGSEQLYQIKIDNTGDVNEDLVFQATFSGTIPNQIVTVRGPVAPNETGVNNTLLTSPIVATGPVNTILGSPTGIQVFAGARDDPFFFDLERFFRIIPDRKPAFAQPLASLPNTPTANSFRHPQNAVDFLAGYIGLSIVIELPTSMLNANGHNPRLGIWATTNRVGGFPN
ncbi:MAG: DUF4331 family protein [Gemmatimonadales bacterium]